MTIHVTNSDRAGNLTRLAEGGRMDLFWRIIYTILIMEDRRITQLDVARQMGRDVGLVRHALAAAVSPERLERRLVEIDSAITEISDERGWKP